MKANILINFDGGALRRSLGNEYAFIDFPPKGPLPAPEILATAKIIVTGQGGFSRQEMDLLPSLGLISSLGSGYDTIDLAAARGKGIAVSYGAGTNAASVADHAIALLLSAIRNIPNLDQSTRRGNWRTNVAAPTIPTGKRMGIIGMGRIGEKIAHRAAGFEIEIAYHTRRIRQDLPWKHYRTATELAQHVDLLVVAAPGGAATRHMINADVLRALGPAGFVVNVGRGTIVDTDALVEALKDGTIAGAGIDVYEDEPNVPAELCSLTNVVLTPHIAAWAPEVHAAAAALVRKNIELFLAGSPIATPVPRP